MSLFAPNTPPKSCTELLYRKNTKAYFMQILIAMRIAQVSPLFESVPPKLYGGTERVVSYLTEELIRLGHDVTLFASGDSLTAARLVSPCAKAIRQLGKNDCSLIPQLVMLEQLKREKSEYDIAHFHLDYLHYSLLREHDIPSVTTMHSRLDIAQLIPLYQEFSEIPVVSISDAQRIPLPWLNWKGTVHHGLPTDLYSLYTKPQRYAAFLGRISPEKRPDRAIEITRRAGIKLKIAAKVGYPDEDYWENFIKPLIAKSPHVEFIGEINETEKNEFLGNATVMIAPIDWPEPFGLVIIEAMACGTPVLAYRCGSTPELIKNGVNGYIVDNMSSAEKCMNKINEIDRTKCRLYFEEHFAVEKMAREYVRVYENILNAENEFEAPVYSILPGINPWKISSNSKTKYI
ncbi:MAG: glycosyltransferase family 4 protein [Oligoflexia bacterium]|nr:glycosyltransferase family 4 protein [Oligoflexia bacterium]